MQLHDSDEHAAESCENSSLALSTANPRMDSAPSSTQGRRSWTARQPGEVPLARCNAYIGAMRTGGLISSCNALDAVGSFSTSGWMGPDQAPMSKGAATDSSIIQLRRSKSGDGAKSAVQISVLLITDSTLPTQSV